MKKSNYKEEVNALKLSNHFKNELKQLEVTKKNYWPKFIALGTTVLIICCLAPFIAKEKPNDRTKSKTEIHKIEISQNMRIGGMGIISEPFFEKDNAYLLQDKVNCLPIYKNNNYYTHYTGTQYGKLSENELYEQAQSYIKEYKMEDVVITERYREMLSDFSNKDKFTIYPDDNCDEVFLESLKVDGNIQGKNITLEIRRNKGIRILIDTQLPSIQNSTTKEKADQLCAQYYTEAQSFLNFKQPVFDSLLDNHGNVIAQYIYERSSDTNKQFENIFLNRVKISVLQNKLIIDAENYDCSEMISKVPILDKETVKRNILENKQTIFIDPFQVMNQNDEIEEITDIALMYMTDSLDDYFFPAYKIRLKMKGLFSYTDVYVPAMEPKYYVISNK